ncbi:MAG: tetratricopeptide repeat protein, partial [Pseudomonadales bacterium]|nr:tetratricopeptide repeat protein [Pseudomonadales bacterium]
MRYAVSLLLLSWTVTAAAQPAGNSNDLVVNLYNEIQSLQNEVLTLRGMVEEQGYQLQRLQAESRDRYLDLDSRLQGIAGPGAMPPLDTPPPLANTVPANTPSATTQAPPFNQPSAPPVATSGGDSQALVLDEQETYRTALSFLLEQSKPAEAILRFQSYIDRFPQGRLFTNALYWQGEALILEQRNQEAVDVFNRLLNE